MNKKFRNHTQNMVIYMDEVTYTYIQSQINYIYSVIPMRTNKVLLRQRQQNGNKSRKETLKFYNVQYLKIR